MIDYINYTVDGKTYGLVRNSDNTWSKEASAPDVTGSYELLFEINENGIITEINSSDSQYSTYLQVVESAHQDINLIKYLPDFLQNIQEFNVLFDTEGRELDQFELNKEKVKDDMFLTSASNDAITRVEKFINIKGLGTLEQRRSYLISLFQKGKKFSEQKIKDITKTITGSDSIVTFLDANDAENTKAGNGVLQIQVLSPDNSKNYLYNDIARALKPLVPGHIDLLVIKYYSEWADISKNYANWTAIKAASSWQSINDYIAPL